MKKSFYLLLFIGITYGCSPKAGQELASNTTPEGVRAIEEAQADEIPIASHIDLVNVRRDKVTVEINPGAFTQDQVTYRLPKVVQGTYAVSNFGSFIDNFKAYDYSGAEIPTDKVDDNTWVVSNASSLDKFTYQVNDTYDIETTEKPTPFSPSGTNIEKDNFVLNLHGFVGYFDELKDASYTVDIKAPGDMLKSSALPLASSTTNEADGTVTDTYTAERYFDVTDNPMMYGKLDIEEFRVGGINILLSVYSPNGIHSAAKIKETVNTMMEAQKTYLGDLDSTPRYDVYLYLAPDGDKAPQGFGALEHHTSTIVVLPESMSDEDLAEAMTDVVSHEFFHIVTPLSVHSEDVHYFDYNEPTFSKHLWMYEGVTEYFATHFQVYEDIQSKEDFYSTIAEKIETSLGLDDEMSFTEMSENVLDEPYASNYFNVYQKGALIGMSIDILMREESKGERSMLSLMKELSAQYGKENPFEDDNIIDQITSMTYPSVGEFLQTHVVGTTPINYQDFFSRVGLELIEEDVVTTFFFIDQQVPYIDANPATKEVFFRNTKLNSSITALGIEPGDVIKSINGTVYNLDNIGAIIRASFQWTPDTDVEFELDRDGERITVSGKVGTPILSKPKLQEMANASSEQITNRNYWLDK